MVYTTFPTSAKYQHFDVYVYFFDFERVISLYENRPTL